MTGTWNKRSSTKSDTERRHTFTRVLEAGTGLSPNSLKQPGDSLDSSTEHLGALAPHPQRSIVSWKEKVQRSEVRELKLTASPSETARRAPATGRPSAASSTSYGTSCMGQSLQKSITKGSDINGYLNTDYQVHTIGVVSESPSSSKAPT